MPPQERQLGKVRHIRFVPATDVEAGAQPAIPGATAPSVLWRGQLPPTPDSRYSPTPDFNTSDEDSGEEPFSDDLFRHWPSKSTGPAAKFAADFIAAKKKVKRTTAAAPAREATVLRRPVPDTYKDLKYPVVPVAGKNQPRGFNTLVYAADAVATATSFKGMVSPTPKWLAKRTPENFQREHQPDLAEGGIGCTTLGIRNDSMQISVLVWNAGFMDRPVSQLFVHICMYISTYTLPNIYMHIEVNTNLYLYMVVARYESVI
jgi:hypothetical protein